MEFLKFFKFSKELFLANPNSYYKLSKQSLKVAIFSYLILFLISMVFPLYKGVETQDYFYLKLFAFVYGGYILYMFSNSILLNTIFSLFKGNGNLLDTMKFIFAINYIQTLYLTVLAVILIYNNYLAKIIYFAILFILLKPWLFILSITIFKTYNGVSLSKSYLSHIITITIYIIASYFILRGYISKDMILGYII